MSSNTVETVFGCDSPGGISGLLAGGASRFDLIGKEREMPEVLQLQSETEREGK